MNTTVEAQDQQVDVSKPMNMVLWTIQIGVAGMFFMAGGSKLSGSEQMVQLFQAIGFGQWFRYLTGFMEVGGAVLLLIPGLSGLGAALLRWNIWFCLRAKLSRIYRTTPEPLRTHLHICS